MHLAVDLSRSGWLLNLVDQAIARNPREASLARVGPLPPPSTRLAAARAFLSRRLHDAGIVYGTPVSSPDDAGPAGEDAHLTAVLSHLFDLALDIATLLDAPDLGWRRHHLSALAATLADRVDLAEKLAKEADDPRLASRLASVEDALSARAISLAGDPVYGLPLHNGATWADARAFGRTAIALFHRGAFDPRAASRRRQYASREKAALTLAIAALAFTERTPSFTARRAILRQIDDMQLPSAVARVLRASVRRAFGHPPSPEALARSLRSASARRFVLEQTVLASLVDGRRSPMEVAFVQRLATAMGFGPQELRAIEVDVAEFYSRNRAFIDVFTVRDKANRFQEEVVDRMVEVVQQNLEAVMQEVRETGELSMLLAKAARGARLSRAEKRKAREQLVDIAKSIPALAVFAAPGGILLLIALARVLPFNILPSAFSDEAGEEP